MSKISIHLSHDIPVRVVPPNLGMEYSPRVFEIPEFEFKSLKLVKIWNSSLLKLFKNSNFLKISGNSTSLKLSLESTQLNLDVILKSNSTNALDSEFITSAIIDTRTFLKFTTCFITTPLSITTCNYKI